MGEIGPGAKKDWIYVFAPSKSAGMEWCRKNGVPPGSIRTVITRVNPHRSAAMMEVALHSGARVVEVYRDDKGDLVGWEPFRPPPPDVANP